jgi:hypothetical protein
MQYIRTNFGALPVRLLKNYSKLITKLANLKSRQIFLLNCKHNGIIPNRIIQRIKCTYKFFENNSRLHNKINNTISQFQYKILNLEIKKTIFLLEDLRRNLQNLTENLNNIIPTHITNNFLQHQNNNYKKQLHRNTEIGKNKLEKMKIRNNINKNLKIMDLTDHIFTQEALNIIGLGPNFNINRGINKLDLSYFIADVDSIINEKIDDNTDINRQRICNIIYNHIIRNDKLMDMHDRNMTKAYNNN